MANALAVSLHALGTTLSANGAGASVDIGSRTVAKLKLGVVLVTAGSLRLIVETSIDDATWLPRHTEQASATVNRTLLIGDLQQYVRVRWEIASGSYQVSLDGKAVEIYCTPKDFTSKGLPGKALDDASTTTVLDLCVAVSDEADGYLGAAFTLPLIAWGEDLTLHCAKMVTRYFLDHRGWDPEGQDQVFMDAYNAAVAWLTKVAKGHISPAGIQDSTPTVVDSGSYVTSRPRREAFR